VGSLQLETSASWSVTGLLLGDEGAGWTTTEGKGAFRRYRRLRNRKLNTKTCRVAFGPVAHREWEQRLEDRAGSRS
jgi:hypothetical protein